MKKREIVWFAVKLIGLYFSYQAVLSCLSLIASLIVAIQTPALFSNSAGILLQQLTLTTLYAITANYLLRNGTYIFDILNSEEPPNSMRESLDEISIK